MLYLLFQIGTDRYALDSRDAVEVIPYLALKKIPQSPRGVAGLFNYRGRPIPALDLCQLAFDRPAVELLSTRIIVVRSDKWQVTGVPSDKCQVTSDEQPRSSLSDGEQWLGLIAERATGMMRREEKEFVNSGVKIGAAPYLGPVTMDGQGVIQLLDVGKLVSNQMREMIEARGEGLEAMGENLSPIASRPSPTLRSPASGK